MGRRKRIRKIERWARNNPPLLPVERQALPNARVSLCEAVAWLATGKAFSGKVLRQMPLSDDIPDDVQTGQKIELAGRRLWDAFGDNDLPMFGHQVNDYGEPSVEIEQIPSEKSLSRRTTTTPPMGLLVDDTISVGDTTYEGVTMRRSDLLKLWPASTPAELPGPTDPAPSAVRPNRAGQNEQRSYPGRPSQMNAIENEMRRRARVREIEPSLAAEARYLSKWVVEAFPDDQTPKPRSIGNALREPFRELMREQHLIK